MAKMSNRSKDWVTNAGSSTIRIATNAFIKANPALDKLLGATEGLNLYNTGTSELTSLETIRKQLKTSLQESKNEVSHDEFSPKNLLENIENSQVSEIIDDEGNSILSINNNDYAIKSGASIGNAFSSLINVNTKGFQNVLYSTEILAIESQNIDSLNYESYSLFNNIAADLVGKTHRDIILTKSRNELFSLSNLTKFDIAKSIRNFPTVGEMIDNKLFGMTSMIAP